MFNRDNITNLKGNRLEVIPERIKGARKYRGMSQTDLAAKLGVTRQAIGNYETNAKKPSIDIILQMTDVLKFPLEFFLKPSNDCDDLGITYFRSQSIAAKQKEMFEQRLDYLAADIVGFIQQYISLPEINLVNIEYKEQYSREHIRKIALDLRELWGLGDRPISNLTHVMQKNGCIISRVDLNSEKTDGYSKWIWNRPYSIVNREKDSYARTRFTLAHELGHIVLHRNLPQGETLKNREAEANYFASEFLFPSHKVIDEIAFISLDSLLPIKSKWGISVAALTRRCIDNDLITDDRYTLLQKQISKRHWRKIEPLDDVLKVESPALFKEAFNLLIENKIITKSTILEEICFSQEELIQICELEDDFFEEKILSFKPNLRVVK